MLGCELVCFVCDARGLVCLLVLFGWLFGFVVGCVFVCALRVYDWWCVLFVCLWCLLACALGLCC